MLASRCAHTLSVALLALTLSGSALAASAPTAMDGARIEQLTGLKGSYSKDENVFKVTKPRNDVAVKVDGVAMAPFMGLTSWAAFTPAHGSMVMVMGDMVLFEDEVNPAMSAALDSGLEVTALHNHFFYDQPKVFFMHIGGMGDVNQLAKGVRAIFDRVAQIRSKQAAPADHFEGDVGSPSAITAAPIEQVLGGKAQSQDGMVKVTVGRNGQMNGTAIGNQMGVNTWAAFAGTDDHAVVDGDFVMRENELQTVLKAMRSEGINIVAIHQHMTGENPRYLFLHYWGKGKAVDLAKSVKKALDAQQAVK